MHQLKKALSYLVRSIAINPQEVFIKEISTEQCVFEIQISRVDYEPILHKLSSLKALAAVSANLSEGTRMVVYLKPTDKFGRVGL